MAMIELKNVTKSFGSITAVAGVSFSIAEGELFALLGPNGAGKTTTLSMLSTLVDPDDGEAFVNGCNVKSQKDSVRKSIGIVFQDQTLDEDLTAYENLDYQARLYGVPKKEREQRISELLQLVELNERAKSFVKTFSGGMKRRLELIRGLLHQPKVLFLDEPTLGLDPQTSNHLWDYIRGLQRKHNITIILTTHYMEEADKLADRVAIIDKGKIIALDTVTNLKNAIGGEVILVETEGDDFIPILEELPWVTHVHKYNGYLQVSTGEAEKRIVELMQVAQQHNISLKSLSIRKPTLEDVFLHFTGKTIREAEGSVEETMRLARRAWRR